FAAGDAAEWNGTLYGIWGPSQYQGTIAGRNMAGAGIEFAGVPPSNTLKVLGLDLFSIGLVEPPDGACEAIAEEVGPRYLRFLFREGRLAGAILLGDASGAMALKRAMEEKNDFSGLLAKHPTAREIAEELGV
ncbi:MAG: pyridine nucleotide-disulfide oxidoreductase, partial [Candidatus Sumerlaeota bacterium]|nr:pyridine nucleotide-disulfide oxidoreductase [Candidatus Sumerlaeota bacterium]